MEQARDRAAEIAEFASQADNWYRIGASDFVPGDREDYVLESGTYRAVFTWTMLPTGKVYRHLSVSAQANGKFPQPVVVFTLAFHFGFKGVELDPMELVHEPGADWGVGTNKSEGCVVLQQEIGDEP